MSASEFDEPSSLLGVLRDIAGSLHRIANVLEADAHGRLSEPRDELDNPREAGDIDHPSTNPSDPAQPKTSGEPVLADRRDVLRNYLSQRSITIKTEREPNDADKVLDQLAVFLGSKYEAVERFYETVKRTMNTGEPFVLNLKNETQEVVGATCQFADMLHKLAFLESYDYRRSPQFLLKARASRAPQCINFFSGGWLERFGSAQVIAVAQSLIEGAPFSFLKNPQIVLPNGDNFELDLLFEFDGIPFWFELKTGDYQGHVSKYSRVSRLLGLPQNRSFMVLAKVPDIRSAQLSALFGMTVTSVNQFAPALRRALLDSRLR